MGEFRDKAKGGVNKAIGKAKQSSGDPRVRDEGTAQETKGVAQNLKGKVKGVINDL